MDLSLQEKSLWALFVSLLGVFGWYFRMVLPPDTTNILPDQVGLFVAAVVVLVITQVVGQSVLALTDRHPETDERDRWIALRGVRNGACVLAVGVFTALCVAVWSEGNFVFIHVLLGFWVLAQLVEIGSQLVLYRRGA